MLRLSAVKLTLSPFRIGGVARLMSPPGGSTLTTSAPMSARSVPHSGPAMKFANSMTRMPASGLLIESSVPALSMTSLYIGTSCWTRFMNAAGPSATTGSPIFSNFSFTSGRARIALNSLARRSITGCGVPASA